MSASSDPLKEVRPGDIFAGRFRIEELLGSGGYGRVYRATQLPLGRSVALKTISTVFEDGAARFAREASFAQRLEHPNTVRLYDFGTTDQGQPFLVLELLRGQSLEQMIDRGGPLPVDTALKTTAQILKSLMEAHALGIIHRDIKPANVFITAHPGEPMFVKVLDFGLAKDLSANVMHTAGGTQVNAAAAAPLTRAGEVMGTATYMAPEQVTGGKLSPRSDLYAVGLVLAEMLLGNPLVQGKTPMAVAMAHASPHPIRLPQVLSESRAGGIISRALAKRPEERYGSAGEMLLDVERALAPAAPIVPKPRGVQLSPRLVIGLGVTIGVLLIVAIVGLALASRWRGDAKKEKARARDREARQDEDEDVRPARSKTSTAAATTVSPKSTGKVKSYAVADIKAKLVAARYDITSDSHNDYGRGWESWAMTLKNDKCSGMVTTSHYPTEFEARAASGGLDGTNGRLFIDGRDVLYVQMAETGAFNPTAACAEPVAALLTK